MGLRLAIALLALSALACGGERVHRPLDLFVGGLSGRAERLVVLLYPGDAGPDCATVTLGTVAELDAPERAEWVRGEDERARGLSFEPLDEGRVTVVAYSEDAAGDVIQVACEDIEYADLETPDFTLQLGERPRS